MTTSWNLQKLTNEVTCHPDVCMKWCEDNGLLPARAFCSEGHEMMLTSYKTCLGMFQCSKKHSDGKAVRYTRSRGTVFESKRMSPEKFIILIYCFAKDMTYQECIVESTLDSTSTCKRTVGDAYSICRELIIQYLLEKPCNTPIGGTSKVVEIVELCLEQRKFNIGPFQEGRFIVLMVERESRDFRVEVCPEDQWSEENLLPLIKKNVLEGSVIVHSDNNMAYSVLSDQYTIQSIKPCTINETGVYVDKSALQKFECVNKDDGADKLLVQLYKYNVKQKNIDEFEALLEIIRHRYPV